VFIPFKRASKTSTGVPELPLNLKSVIPSGGATPPCEAALYDTAYTKKKTGGAKKIAVKKKIHLI
jgi:hypothetical protein